MGITVDGSNCFPIVTRKFSIARLGLSTGGANERRSGSAVKLVLEPVTHSVDAHNQPGQPGLAILDKGETMTLKMKIGWLPYGS